MKETIPTDVEIFGYRNAQIIDQEVTDEFREKDLNYCDFRVQFNPNRLLIIDLGHGREVRIHLHANKVNLDM